MLPFWISLRRSSLNRLWCSFFETGYDAQDSTSSQQSATDYSQALTNTLDSKSLKGKKIAIISQTLGDGVNGAIQDAIQQAIDHFKSLGAEVQEVSSSVITS